MDWNEKLFENMIAVASRAPSVHNVQPWKVQFSATGFRLFQSFNRRLLVGDPALHDNDVSLGCFMELCGMFLRKKGFEMAILKDDSQKIKLGDDQYESRFRISLMPASPQTDDLYDMIPKRRAFRGRFEYDTHFNEDVLKEIKTNGVELKWFLGPAEMKKWAKIYDEGSSKINQKEGYFKELVHWLRFSESDPKFFEDGLNYKSLSLGKMDAILGRFLFKESVFKTLSKLSLEKVLITEAPQIQSAQGIIIVYADRDLSALDMGRAFVRFWLALTSKGLYACPLSALVDFTQTKDILNSLSPSNDKICLNVLRFGKVADENTIYSSPRLDVGRVILK